VIEHLAILGATGAVGREACRLIEERGLGFGRLSLLGSARTAGTRITVAGETIEVAEAGESGFDGVTHAIFSAGAERSRRFAPIALRAGAVIVDNSSAFRMDAGVPLVIPEINPDDLRHHDGIIANPNCSALIMDVVAWPLHRVNRLRRIVVSTYQAASGAGAAAMQELVDQSRAVLRGERPAPKLFPHPIAFNLFSHDSSIGPDGYNAEERKIIQETRKIFHAPELAISATCIRIPVRRAHSESINLTFENPITLEEAREILDAAPGVRVVDDVEANRFPMPLEAEGRDEVLVGRIRQDAGQPDGRGLELFACGDQLRKGAALNAIQILELLAAAAPQ
jgi:aspartate-semialdehyde dehydrogenase